MKEQFRVKTSWGDLVVGGPEHSPDEVAISLDRGDSKHPLVSVHPDRSGQFLQVSVFNAPEMVYAMEIPCTFEPTE